MGLPDIIRNAVAIANKVTIDLQVPVEHYPWISDGATYGEPVYGDPTTRLALVEMRQRMMRIEGQDILLKAIVSFLVPIEPNGAENRQEPIDPRDKIVLPNGYTGPIKTIEGLENNFSDTPYTLEVTLG